MNRTNATAIYAWVKRIPKGKVATYGAIARRAKVINPRTVGFYLHKNPDPQTIPCHRVVNSRGQLARNFAFGGAVGQRAKLEAEGVVVINNSVDLTRFGWDHS